MPMRTLLCLQDEAPYLAPKAAAEDVRFVCEALEDLDVPELPDDFAAFLTQTNGFVWNGIEIFGTEPIVIERSRSVAPALLEINASFADRAGMHARVVIGRSSTELYVFDVGDAAYLILDRQRLAPRESFAGFVDLLRAIVDAHR